METKKWVEAEKEFILALSNAARTFAEMRDAIMASWGVTRKQANKFCMQYFSAALEKDDQEEQQNG